ncbi:MAG: hypothetical protein V4457_05945 [Pseudomonadota bacterium]
MFQGPCYNLSNNGVSISSAITALQLKAGVNGPIEIMRASLTQSSITTSGQCLGGLIRKSAAATVTIAVAGTNLKKLNPAAPTADASLGTAATGFTASAEGSDSDLTTQRGFNTLNGWEYLPIPEERMMVPQAGICGLKFLSSPTSATWVAEIAFRELRGG